jgi:hypothetical protein
MLITSDRMIVEQLKGVERDIPFEALAIQITPFYPVKTSLLF